MTAETHLGSIFFGLSVPLAVYFVVFFLCPKYKIERTIGYISISVVLLSAAYGAHWWYLALHPPQNAISWILLNGGLKSYGAIVGGIIGAAYCARRYKVPVVVGLAAALEGGVLSLWCVRIGCTLNQEHLGPTTNVPWAVMDRSGTLRHNMGLYELLFLSATLLPYVILTAKKPPNTQQTTLGIFIGYGLFKITERLVLPI
jgi:prolipoprotein diacylglyceryltransferase